MNISGPFHLWTNKDDLTRLIAGELIAGTDAETIARKVCDWLQPHILEIQQESERMGADIQCPHCNWAPTQEVKDETGKVIGVTGGGTTFGGHLIHPCDSGCCNAQYCTECKKFWYLAEMKDTAHYEELVKPPYMEIPDERKDG